MSKLVYAVVIVTNIYSTTGKYCDYVLQNYGTKFKLNVLRDNHRRDQHKLSTYFYRRFVN